jgi:hypothetical protein
VTIVHLQTLRRRRRAREQRRNASGEFQSGRSREELLRIVRAGALAAVATFPKKYDSPDRVCQRDWNAVRAQLEPQFGRVPQANEICRQIRERVGDARLSWPRILELALGDLAKTRNVLKAIAGEEPADFPTTVAGFGLLAIARRLRLRRPSPLQYDEGRRRAITERRRTRAGPEPLHQVLPTSDQIIATFGSWEAALAFVGLGQDAGKTHGGVPVEDAFALFYAATGRLPKDRPELYEFAKCESFSLARMAGRTWPEWTRRGLARIREFPELPLPKED